jgi:hypothetical protein
VTDPSELPDPPEGCDFILARVVDESSFLVTLYEWHEGEGWHFHTDINGNIYTNGTIDSFDYDAIDGWSVIVNGETYSGNGNALLDSPVYSLDVTFISNSGCSYTIETIGEEPCYWYWQEADISGGFLIYPEGGAGVSITAMPDVVNLQLTYPYFAVLNSGVGFQIPILIYAPASVVQNWDIDYGSGQVPMTWQPTDPACPEQQTRCYTATLDIDLTTYPDALLFSINSLGVVAPLSSNLLTDIPNLEIALNEYLSSVFGGVVTTAITYVGTTYTINVYNVPYYVSTPNIELNLIEVEREQFDYVGMSLNQITCP